MPARHANAPQRLCARTAPSCRHVAASGSCFSCSTVQGKDSNKGGHDHTDVCRPPLSGRKGEGGGNNWDRGARKSYCFTNMATCCGRSCSNPKAQRDALTRLAAMGTHVRPYKGFSVQDNERRCPCSLLLLTVQKSQLPQILSCVLTVTPVTCFSSEGSKRRPVKVVREQKSSLVRAVDPQKRLRINGSRSLRAVAA